MVSSSKHSKANKLRSTIVVVAAALFGSYSCANQASCDPGWEVEGSSCVRTTAPVDEPEGEGGAAGAVAQAPVCDPSAPPEGSFGAPCQDGVSHTDCACPAPVCAIQPGSTEGFCTQTDCVNDPSVCPSGWTCFDLSAIDPSYPPLCVAQ